MIERRTDLKSFNMERLQRIRELRNEMYCGGNNRLFLDELEHIITSADYNPTIWERKENNDIILGEVWSQPIGIYRYLNTVHKYEDLYIASNGLVIGEHGHEELVHNNQDIRKIKEWYIFPDGSMQLCRKGETHKLIHYGEPMYVISLKIWNHSRYKSYIE